MIDEFLKQRKVYSHWMLVFSLFVILSVAPFFQSGNSILLTVLSLNVFLSIYSISFKKRDFFILCIFALPVITSIIVFHFQVKIAISFGFVLLSLVLFYGLCISKMWHFLFKSKKIDNVSISASICIYFYMIIFFAAIYGCVDLIVPGSYNFLDHSDYRSNLNTLIYFSTVTLTSLGYGDMLPLSAQARSVSALQAVAGQLYLAIVVARLVSLSTSETDVVEENL